jgi:hypothetical protein
MTTSPALSTGTYWVDLPCPRCGVLAPVSVHLGSSLTVPDDGGPSLRLTAKSKPIDHWCGQRAMLTTPDLALFDPDEPPTTEDRRYPT